MKIQKKKLLNPLRCNRNGFTEIDIWYQFEMIMLFIGYCWSKYHYDYSRISRRINFDISFVSLKMFFCHSSYISSNKLRSFVHAPIKEMQNIHKLIIKSNINSECKPKWIYRFYFMFYIYYWIITYLVNLFKNS